MKFKKGDRVIITDTSSDVFLHKTATVLGEGEDDDWEIELDEEVTLYYRNSRIWEAVEDQLELEAVLNSPLYKALS
jgi:hypothetical protein